jgi:polysaccharide biosynthesis transport protein
MSSGMMLQNAAVDEGDSPASIHEMIETVQRLALRQWWIITLGLLAAVAAAWTFLSIVPIYYEATATILLDPRRVQLFQQPTVIGDDGIGYDVDSQIELLHSSSIAQKVISALNLADDPEFRDQIRFGASKGDEGTLNEREILARFDKRLTVKRVGGTFALDISFEAEDPKKASTIANAVVDAYLRDQADEKKGVLRQTGDWLGDRLLELREQTTAAEEAVNSFRIKNGLLDAGDGRSITEQRILELNSLLVDARGRTAEARAQFAHSDDALKAISRSPTTWHASELMNNQVAIKLREQYLELAGREADWRQKYGANH